MTHSVHTYISYQDSQIPIPKPVFMALNNLIPCSYWRDITNTEFDFQQKNVGNKMHHRKLIIIYFIYSRLSRSFTARGFTSRDPTKALNGELT